MFGTKITITIPGDPGQLSRLRAALRGLAKEAGLSRRQVARLELAVTEAASNCIRHAHAGDTDGEVRVEWGEYPDHIELAVCDRGPGMAPELLEQVGDWMLEIDLDDPSNLRSSGRGLALIKNSMDRVSYIPGESWNRLEMVLRRELTSDG